METEFCTICEGRLDEDERCAGFCIFCEVRVLVELVQEAERQWSGATN